MKRFATHIFTSLIAFAGGFIAAAKAYHTPVSTQLSLTDNYLQHTFNFVKAVDGDTLDISSQHGNILRVRLHGIDTPERGKFYYAKAAAELETLCKDTPIRLSDIGDGGFGRTSANVYCGGIHVNAKLIESGAAMTAIKFADDPALYALQDTARENCSGIWARPIGGTYAAKKLSGPSPLKGDVTITSHRACIAQTARIDPAP